MSLHRLLPAATLAAAALVLSLPDIVSARPARPGARQLAQHRYLAQKRSSPRNSRATARKPTGPPKSKLKASGSIKGIRPGLLEIVTGESEKWLIRVEAKPQDRHFIGQADVSWLRPGMFVRIVGPFNKRGQAQAAIDKVEVFTPGPKTRLGVFSEESRVDLESPPAARLAPPDARLAPSADHGGESESLVKTYEIVGRLRDAKKGWITVGVGRTAVRAPLAQDAAVSFNVSDFRFARVGDNVELEGYYYPRQPRCGYATKITIRAAQPLIGPTGSRREGEKAGEGQSGADVPPELRGSPSGEPAPPR